MKKTILMLLIGYLFLFIALCHSIQTTPLPLLYALILLVVSVVTALIVNADYRLEVEKSCYMTFKGYLMKLK